MESPKKYEKAIKTIKVLSAFLLLPLATIPPDIGTSIFWLFALLLVVRSIFRIPFILLKRPIDIYSLVSHVLVVTIFFISIISVRYSYREAKQFAKSQAYLIKEQCERDGKCPNSILGWRVRGDAFSCDLAYGKIAKYYIRYRQIEQGSKFELTVRENIDNSYYIHGGVFQDVVFK